MAKLTVKLTTPSTRLLEARVAQLQEELMFARQRIAILEAQTGPTCVMCPSPATVQDGDWDLCEDCHARITAWPVCGCGQVLTEDDVELGKEQCEACRQAGRNGGEPAYRTAIIFPAQKSQARR